MATRKTLSRGLAVAAVSVGLSAALAPAAQALDTFTLHGVFNGTTTDPTTGTGTPVITDTVNAGPAGANILTANEPFTMTGVFDPSNVVFNFFQGFNAYAPLSVTLAVGGQTYSVETYGQDPTTGFTVALFDKTSIFGGGTPGTPGNHVAAGFLQNPPADGAGIIADFTNSNPNFLVTNLVNADYSSTNYFGVGFGSGPCPYGPGPGGTCLPKTPGGPIPPNTVVPIPLDGGVYSLTLGTYDLNNPANLGLTGFPPGFFVNPNDNLFSATLTIPEPSTWALLLVGFAGLAAAGFRNVRNARLTA
jgi:PEP-CTERM motif